VSTTRASGSATARRRPQRGWRIVDIVTAATIAAAFGVVFWAWSLLWAAASPAFVAFPPAQGFMYGVWLMPGVLGALIIRKPGAAIFVELVAATIEALLGSHWGLTVVMYGLLQGLAVELAFAAGRYRAFGAVRAVMAGALAGFTAANLDRLVYYPTWSGAWFATYAGLVTLSAAVIAGLGAYLLFRRLADTGVLAPFASGRRAREV
jgi:energy-coupling factor transport system substrate-specific component